jgi:hypothetical protein
MFVSKKKNNLDTLLSSLIFHGDICQVNFGTKIILQRMCATEYITNSKKSCSGKGSLFLNEIENVVRFVNIKNYE